jgi:hypothetical protein
LRDGQFLLLLFESLTVELITQEDAPIDILFEFHTGITNIAGVKDHLQY